MLSPLIQEHQHPFPATDVIAAVFDHTALPSTTDPRADNAPIGAALAATTARCMPCQDRVAAWLATHAAPQTIVRLTVPVARDAYRLAVSWTRTAATSGTVVLQSLLAVAFGKDVANVAAPLFLGDVAAAVAQVQCLQGQRRETFVRSLLTGIAHPPPPELHGSAARRSA
jgi:hypothetical protein